MANAYLTKKKEQEFESVSQIAPASPTAIEMEEIFVPNFVDETNDDVLI